MAVSYSIVQYLIGRRIRNGTRMNFIHTYDTRIFALKTAGE